MLNQVEAEGSKTDNRHPTGKRWTIAVVGFAKQGCAQYVAIEANTAVEIPDRQAHVMYARYLRMAHFAVHGVDDASCGDPNRADRKGSSTCVPGTAIAPHHRQRSHLRWRQT